MDHSLAYDSRQHDVASATGKYACDMCDKSFTRSEHLKRHMNNHTKEKRFACCHCRKEFSRNDILQRHELTHIATDRSPSSAAARNQLSQDFRSRACDACARARARCSREQPCARCVGRSLDCNYSKFKGKSSRAKLTAHDVAQHSGDGSNDLSSPEHLTAAHTVDTNLLDVTANYFNGNGQDRLRATTTTTTTIGQPENDHPHSMDIDSNTGMLSHGNFSTATMAESLLAQSRPAVAYTAASMHPNGQQANLNGERWRSSHMPLQVVKQQIADAPQSIHEPHFQGGLPVPSQSSVMMNWLPFDFEASFDNSVSFPFCFGNFPESDGGLACASVTQEQDHLSPMQTSPTSLTAESEVSHHMEGSCTSSISESPSRKAYYVDSDGSRISCTTRQPSLSFISSAVAPEISSVRSQSTMESVDEPNFPHLSNIGGGVAFKVYPPKLSINNEVYQRIYDAFRACCCSHSLPFPCYSSDHFVPVRYLNEGIGLYFKHFHDLLPFLHFPTFEANGDWRLTLAVASIGLHYLDYQHNADVQLAMHEFLRRVIWLETERESGLNSTLQVALLQAMLLNQISMQCGHSQRLRNCAAAHRGQLIDYIKSEGPSGICFAEEKAQSMNFVIRTWKDWIPKETTRRLIYAIMLSDCITAYNTDFSPKIPMNRSNVILPSSELAWEAASEQAWRAKFDASQEPPAMMEALKQLYIEKKLPEVGEFSQVLLLHAVFQETWEVGRYYQRQFSSWVPTAERSRLQSELANLKATDDSWIPREPIFTKWRNAACDCIDTLHWAANSTIALAAGAEHPLVLQLHLARTVLLAPCTRLRILARFLSSGSTLSRSEMPPEVLSAEQEILHWVSNDYHKARLTVIHAGCFYWHMRRYAKHAFFEPNAVFLVTLVLWAYGTFAPLTLRNGSRKPYHDSSRSGSASPSIGTTDETPPAVRREDRLTFARVDRPMDDEMVQLFIREGWPSTMTAYITNVGDVCSPRGPSRILKEAIKLLRPLNYSWGISVHLAGILEEMSRHEQYPLLQ